MKILYQYFLFVNVLSLQDDDVKPIFVSKVKKGKWFIKVEKMQERLSSDSQTML